MSEQSKRPIVNVGTKGHCDHGRNAIQEAFEEWAFRQGHNVCRHHLDHNDYSDTSTFFMWNAYQQATAEANKRMAELEGDVAELKERYEANTAILHGRTQCMNELQASNHTLREALEYYADNNTGIECAIQTLAATPAESLAKHDADLIEKCANVCDKYYADGVGNTIRLLKGK